MCLSLFTDPGSAAPFAVLHRMAHGPGLWNISMVPPSLDALRTCLCCLIVNPALRELIEKTGRK